MSLSLADLRHGPQISSMKILIYGPEGVGKNTWAAGAPNPVFIPTEEGQGKLNYSSFPLCTDWGMVLDAIGALYNEDHQFQTVVLDSLDWTERLIWKAVNDKYGGDSIDDQNVKALGYGKGFGYALDYWRDLIAGMNALNSHRKMIVILTAHSSIRTFNSPEVDAYDRYELKLQNSQKTSASALICEWCDVVGFAGFKVFTSTKEQGGKKTTKATGGGERILRLDQRPAFLAKNRYDLPAELPMPKEGGWKLFEEAISKSLNIEPPAQAPKKGKANG
jgi:hypothetical protein